MLNVRTHFGKHKPSHRDIMSDKKFNDKIPCIIYLCKPHNNTAVLHQKQEIISPCHIMDLKEDGINDKACLFKANS